MTVLSPSERDRLLLFTTAELARRRRSRGLRLNVPEATAIVADTVCEAARDGLRLAEAIEAGRSVLGADDVLPGVVGAVPDVRVEAVFDDGTRLAVVRDPFRAGLTRSSGLDCAIDTVGAGAGAGTVAVTNTADVTIGVTSHFHFFEANPRLRFDRAAAYGMHLAIEAGAAVRWEPGQTRTVPLAPIGGRRVVIGFAGLVDGPLDEAGAKERALERARACGYEGA
ncbi:MAG TPA: urease subunit gamma [Streptosporangiaceae bacterium]|nr:urease subunit gamma [Streptosporangiaceae bacterium]